MTCSSSMLLTSMPLLHTIPFTDSLVRSPPTPAQDTPSLNQLFLPTNLPIPSSSSSISITKPPPPPPPSLPRKQDATSHTLRIVNPPKESCFEYIFCLSAVLQALNHFLAYLSCSQAYPKEAQSPGWRHKSELLWTSLTPIHPAHTSTIVLARGSGSSFPQVLSPSGAPGNRAKSVRQLSF